MSSQPLRILIDGSLLNARATGDTAYWRGLLFGLQQRADLEIWVGTNGPGIVPFGHAAISSLRMNPRWFSLVGLAKLAKQIKADIVHTQYNVSPLLGKRAVTTIHDVSFFIGPEWFSPRDRFILQRMIPASVRRARAVITVSQTSKSEIEKFIPASVGKTFVCLNALDPEFKVTSRAEARAILSTEFGMTEPYLLTAGTRWPRKNMDLAIQASKLANVKLVIAGRDGDRGDLPDHVRALGYVDDRWMPALYAAADLYLAPSLHEGFGIPLLEAFASQTPVVCGSGGALPEVAGGAARVMPSYDPASWADAIRDLLDDSSKVSSLQERGLARLKDFDWRRSADEAVAAYHFAASWTRASSNS